MKSFLKMIFQILRRFDLILYYRYYRRTHAVVENQVLFYSESREDLSGNFYYIYEAIKNDYLVKTVLKGSTLTKKQRAYLMATSHYILVDDFAPAIYPIPLRKQTRLIQVWHALGAFKTVGFARRNNKDRFSMTHRNYTDAIVSSPSIINDYAKAYRMDPKKIQALGIPRTDVFFDEAYKEKTRDELYERYPMLKEKKVILFAPTFRGGNIHNAYYDYDQINFEGLKEELGDDYFCIIKMHPFIKQNVPCSLDPSFYLDLSKEREINDLLFITDILITDYSSVIFEASLLKIPTLFFAYDLEEYITQRDFFYSYDHYTYGPVVKNQEELIQAIQNCTIDEKKLNDFIKTFTISCDGHSTQRFIETLLRRKL